MNTHPTEPDQNKYDIILTYKFTNGKIHPTDIDAITTDMTTKLRKTLTDRPINPPENIKITYTLHITKPNIP